MARKTTTLFAKWRNDRAEASKETEDKYLNPLGLKLDGPGDVVSIDSLDWRELDFNCRQFRVLTRNIGGEEFPITDYFLRHRPLDGDDIECVLRYIPIPDSDGVLTHQVFLLSAQDEFEYSEEVMNVLKANSGYTYFVPGENDGEWLEETFPTRVDEVSLPYDCEVATIKDVDGDGDVHDDEVVHSSLTFWDFWRVSVDEELGEEFTEYLFAEITSDDGWTTLYLGSEIDPATVVKV